MLFPYRYVPHQMEKMQRFVNFIFYQVWCTAPKTVDFSLSLFDANPKLKEVMISFFYDHTIAGDLFYRQVECIFGHFSKLSRKQIAQFKRWYQANNNIEKVCANDSALHLARYSDITPIYKDLSEQLALFFKGLYSQSLLDLATIKAKIGNIDDHYQAFMSINDEGKCPFCGINDLMGVDHSKREAYDHYLPKVLYPFNSINFRNLVPACHQCNSSYKTSKDPAYMPKDPARTVQRRKVFYPYAGTPYAIVLKLRLLHSDIGQLRPADVDLQFGPPSLSDEIDTWKDVYGIEERYKAKFCAKNDGKFWLTQVLDEWKHKSRSPADFLDALTSQAANNPYAECNFLKKPFLDACEQSGIFNVLPRGA